MSVCVRGRFSNEEMAIHSIWRTVGFQRWTLISPNDVPMVWYAEKSFAIVDLRKVVPFHPQEDAVTGPY